VAHPAGAAADVTGVAVVAANVAPAIADCARAAYLPFSATSTTTLPAGDGAKVVGVCLRDGAGNTSAAASNAAITLDTTPPTGASLLLAGGAGVTRSTAVTATIRQSGADQMKLVTVDNGADVETFVGVATSANVVVEDGAADGPKTVLVVLRDLAGNEVTASSSILLDRAPPSAPSVVIDGGAAVTASASVTLTLSAVGASEVQIAPDGLADSEPFVPFTGTAVTTLVGADCAAGVACKTVQVVFRDAAGNLSAAANDSIVLDSAAPAGTSLALASSTATDAAGFATTTALTATLSYPADAVRFKLGEGAADCAAAAGYAALDGSSPDSAAFVASAADGQKVVVACLQDAAGNASSTTASIVLDRSRPVGAIVVNGGAQSANGTAVTIAVTPQSDDVDRVAFVNDVSPACSSALTYQALTSSMAHVLADADGTRTVFACFRDVAGNFSFAPVSDGILLDRTAPAVVFDVKGTAGSAPGDAGAVRFSKSRDTLVSVSSLSADAVALAVVNGSVVATCAAQPFEALQQPLQLPLTESFVLSDVDGARDVTVCAKDAAGNVSGAARVITLDRAPPQGAIALTTSGGLVTSTTIAGTLTITPVATDPLRAVASADPAIDCAGAAFSGAFATLSSSISQVVPAGDGQKFVVRCLQDRAGNVAKVSQGATLDGTRPTLASFSLDNGAAASLDTTVTADFTGVATDVTQLALSKTAIADCSGASFGAFVDGGNVTALVEGANTVFACLKDAAGNVSDADPAVAGLQPFTDAITVDTQDPTLSTFAIGGLAGAAPDATFIANRSAVVKIDRADLAADVVAVAFDNTTINCATASYELLPQPVPATFSKNIELADGVDGSRAVAVCVKDGAGRTNGGSGLTRSITLDTTPPQLTTFTINSGASITNSAAVTVSLTSSPSNDPLRIAFSTDPATDCTRASFSGSHAALPSTRATSLASTSGTKFLVGCLQDRAGNVSSFADDIEFDVDVPAGVDRACADCNVVGGLGFTNSADAVQLELSSTSPDIVSALTLVSEDETAPRAENRACTVDGNCRTAVGEQCRAFPVADGVGDGPPTLALRCVEVQPDLGNVFVSLATAAAPVNGAAGVAATPQQGLQKMAIAVVDAAGNVSNAKDFAVVRDTVAPTPALILAGLSGSGITNEQTVFIRSLSVPDERSIGGVVQLGTFQASSLATFADSAELPYAAAQVNDSFPVTLSNGDGAKTVAVRFVDNAGNVNDVNASDVGVTLDTTAPTDPLFSNAAEAINGGDSVVVGALAVQSTDANLPSGRPYSISGVRDCESTGVLVTSGSECSWDGTTPFTLASTNLDPVFPENRIRVKAVDSAANASNEDFLLITRDATAPNAPQNPLRVQERSGSVTFTWGPSSSGDVVGYLVEYGYDDAVPGALTPGNFAAEGPSPVFVPFPQTGVTLTGLSDDTSIELRVIAVDRVQNRSTPTQIVVALPNPVTPVTVSVLPRAGAANSNFLAVRGPRAFAKKGNAVCGYDVADPAAISERTCANLVAGDHVHQFGRFLYVTNENPGQALRVIDTTVASPVAVAINLGTNSNVEEIAFAGRTAFGMRLAGGQAQLITLQQPSTVVNNVSGLLAIAQTVTTTEAGNPLAQFDGVTELIDANMRFGIMATPNLFNVGAFLTPFTVDANNGLITRVGDPGNNVGALLRGQVRALRIDGDHAYVGTTSGLFVVRIDTTPSGSGTNTLRVVVLGSVGGFECGALDVLGGYAYCNDSGAGASNRLSIIDVSDDASPELVGRMVQVPNAGLVALDVEDNFIYGTRVDGGLEAISLWTPTRFEIDGVDGDEPVFDVAVDGNLAIGATGTLAPGFLGIPTEKNAFVTWDLRQRTAVTRLLTRAQAATGGSPGRVSLAGHVAIHVTDNGRAMDIVDPVGGNDINLIRVNTTGNSGNCPAASTGNSVDVAAFGNYAVIASSGNGGELEVWSLASKNGASLNALCLSRIAVPNIRRVSDVVDAQVATLSSDGVMRIVSLFSLTNPQVVAAKTVSGLGSDVDGFGNVELRGDHVIVGRSGVGGAGLLRRIDISGAPTTTATIARAVGGFAVVGNTVIAGDGRRINTSQESDVPSLVPGLLFFDPADGAYTARTQTLGVIAPWAVAVAGPTVIAASDGSGLQLLTVSR
jgi:hypothetical protein